MISSTIARVCANSASGLLALASPKQRLAEAVDFDSVLPTYLYRSRYLDVIPGAVRVCRSLQPAENTSVRTER